MAGFFLEARGFVSYGRLLVRDMVLYDRLFVSRFRVVNVTGCFLEARGWLSCMLFTIKEIFWEPCWLKLAHVECAFFFFLLYYECGLWSVLFGGLRSYIQVYVVAFEPTNEHANTCTYRYTHNTQRQVPGIARQ